MIILQSQKGPLLNNVFNGLGHIGDSTFRLSSDIKPVQHTQRRFPVALQDDVKAKLAGK